MTRFHQHWYIKSRRFQDDVKERYGKIYTVEVFLAVLSEFKRLLTVIFSQGVQIYREN